VEKTGIISGWGSFQDRFGDHFWVGIVSELGIISGSASFRGLYRERESGWKLKGTSQARCTSSTRSGDQKKGKDVKENKEERKKKVRER